MNSFQRMIKYIAIAFAILLAVGILSAAASLINGVISIATGRSFFFGKHHSDRIDFTEEFTGVESLDIENSSGALNIKTGNSFLVEGKNVAVDFKAKLSPDGTLTVTEKDDTDFLWFHFSGVNSPASKITIYLPVDFIADDVKLVSGAGNVSIEQLKADRITIKAGAGSFHGSNMEAEKVSIDGGFGNIKLSDVSFKDAEIKSGFGNLKLQGGLYGYSRIDWGVGGVDMLLSGSRKDYDLDIDTGLGNVRINGEKITKTYRSRNDAENTLKVNGGLGSININFEQE